MVGGMMSHAMQPDMTVINNNTYVTENQEQVNDYQDGGFDQVSGQGVGCVGGAGAWHWSQSPVDH